MAFLVASLFALFLGLLSILFPNDVPFERRDYMATSDRHLKEMMLDNSLRSSHHSNSIIRTSNLENVEAKQKPLPIITAKVTAQISID